MSNENLVFGSVCSGIEAASVAWESLGWKASWFSEIEPFPCAVLAHHYPGVQNLGDMTAIAPRILAGEICAPDIFCGGTPCQAFSVAGLRRSLDDTRGSLTLTFCDIADAIDSARTVRGQHPAVIFWENVPGVLNTKDNAFGCFLGALSGEGCELQPAGGKWANAGCVFGPQRTVAWRILDAQYFGVAQRRRRVFVVASARKGFDPTAVLFEFDGVRRDTAPRRETRQGAPTIPARSTAGGGLGPDFDCGGVIPELAKCITTGTGLRYDADTDTILPVAFAENSRHEIRLEGGDGQRTGALSTGGGKPGQGVPMITFHPTQDQISSTCGTTRSIGCGLTGGQASVAVAIQDVRGTDKAQNGRGWNDDGTAYTLDTHATQGVAYAVALRGREGGATAELGDEVQNCLRAASAYVLCETLYNKGFSHGGLYASTQETHAGKILRTLREAVGEEAFAKWGLGILDSLQSPEILRQALHGVSIRPAAFSRSWVVHCALSRPENGSGWLLQSLREAGCERCTPQGWEPSEQLAGELGAYLSELSQPGAQASRFVRDLWWASQGSGLLREALSAVQEVGRPTHGQSQPVHAGAEGFGAAGAEGLQGAGLHREISRDRVLQQARAASEAGDSGCSATEQERGGQSRLGQTPFAVRRLTVEECEFLQGFPRGYTAIPWGKKPASECPDSPRYKVLGNSWAVPVVRWIGSRILKELSNA